MNDILNWIANADDEQISKVILAVIDRYGAVHPDWEVCFLSLPKNDPKERKRYMRALSAILLHEKSQHPEASKTKL